MVSRGGARRPDTDKPGWFRACTRCGADSDETHSYPAVASSGSFRHITTCPFVRGDWLCSFCWDTHRRDCPACKKRKT